jgi:hypothetical protein
MNFDRIVESILQTVEQITDEQFKSLYDMPGILNRSEDINYET